MTIKRIFCTRQVYKGILFNAVIHCFILFFFLASPSVVSAQDAKVNISLENADLKQLFGTIEKQSQYRFSYRDADINGKEKVTVSAKSQTVATLLNSVLTQRKLQFSLVGNKIIITPLRSSNAHKMKVAGIVKDATGEPLIGVSVVVAGNGSVGTVTDISGNFALPDVASDAHLQFSYIGYQTQELAAKNSMNIIMQEDSKTLAEVVVIGYGVQKKANLSGAVSTVATKQLEDRPVLNIGQALQGTVANLNVNIGSGQAINTPKFNIRGTTSLNGGEPLIVIDGVASDAGQLNRMNANDIASVSVLKDAASCAIYGARAAYGVILVTTKIGESEKLSVNYNSNFSFRQNTRMPEIITDPYDVAVMRNTMYYPWGTLYNNEQLEYAKKVSEDPSLSPYYLTPDGTYQYFGETDWVDETYKKSAFAMNHSIDISGSTDKLDYYLSAGYTYEDGMIKYNTDTYNRYNLSSKFKFKISKNWNISNSTTVTTYDYKAPSRLDKNLYWEINRVSPLDVLRNPDGTWTKMGASTLGILADGGDWKKYETMIRTQFGSRLDIIKDVFFIQGTFAYTTYKNREQWFYSPIAYTDGPDRAPKYIQEVSSAYAKNGDTKDLYIDLYATFNKTFKEKHAVTVMVGFNQDEYTYYNNDLSRQELISTSVPGIGLATGEMGVGEGQGAKATRSGFGRVGYVYDDKYILEFNGRYDGTSVFPKNDRFVFSPSASAGWVVSREKFFEPLTKVISFFKIRGSYGLLGNQDLKDNYYPYLAAMGANKMGAIIDGKQPVSIKVPGLVSGNLTWEKVSTMNIGADLNFFENRLSLSGEYYIRRTKDMLTAGQTLPEVLGTGVPLQNAADLKTRGWELTVGYKDQFKVAGKPMNIGFNFNLADSRAFITKFENPEGLLTDYYEGYELGQQWGLTTLGFFTSEEDIKNHADQTAVTSYPGMPPTAPGDLKFADLNKDGKVDKGSWTLKDHGDYSIIGNSTSRYTFGFSANADWNGFDLSAFFQGVGKKDYFPGAGDLYFWGVYAQPWTNITKGNFYDHWTEESPNAYFPRLKSYVAYTTEAAEKQTRYKQNAAYIRMKNLTLGYTLPKSITQKVNIDHLRIFFSGDNLFVLSGLYKHYKIDPELLSGEDYPLQRAYSIGLNLSF